LTAIARPDRVLDRCDHPAIRVLVSQIVVVGLNGTPFSRAALRRHSFSERTISTKASATSTRKTIFHRLYG
jgi:hypothetical protein